MACGNPQISPRVVRECGLLTQQAGIDLDGQDIPVRFLDDVQGSKGFAVLQRVTHEVQAPLIFFWVGAINGCVVSQEGAAFVG